MPRPKAFDPAAKLDEAMLLFWSQGFDTTSIPKLEQALKINRFSIYDTFGDKRTLFIKVLERYTDSLVKALVVPLENGGGGIADLQAFLGNFRRKFIDSKQASGCLLCNTATEIGQRDTAIAGMVDSYFKRVDAAFLACLERARDRGEIDGSGDELAATARLLRSSVEGMLVELRLAADAQQAAPTLAAIEAFVRGLERR